MNKAFFLDRDGTINIDTDYVHKPEEWVFCDGAVESIRWMNNHDFKVIVVTNQSGVARGRYSMNEVYHLHRYVDDLLAEEDARVDAWYVCPHHPEHTSDEMYREYLHMRKPETGMFDAAIRRFKIDPSLSYMAGDKITDLMPAIKLGVKPFYIKSRFHEKQDLNWLAEHRIETFENIGQIPTHFNESKLWSKR